MSTQRADVMPTPSQALWTSIRNSMNALSFERYQQFIESIMSSAALSPRSDSGLEYRAEPAKQLMHNHRLPFPGIEPYRLLKVASDVFMMAHCASLASVGLTGSDDEARPLSNVGALESHHSSPVLAKQLETFSNSYLQPSGANDADEAVTLLWNVIQLRLGQVPIQEEQIRVLARKCHAMLKAKVTNPCFLELLWNYWHEEGMLVQTLNAIIGQFQNRRRPTSDDPLAKPETDPLRPLNNLLWGWVQDEQHRLTVSRRSYEYDHEYGLRLIGKAVPQTRSTDGHSRFLEGFHNLLRLCTVFYKEDDDITTTADGSLILSTLRDVHRELAQGAHNQYGDLPWTARQEFLMTEWLVARPEMREFLPSPAREDHPEPWMGRVETMKIAQGWTGTSILHFRDLGIFGEKIVLSVRYGLWTNAVEADSAAKWARFWRPEIQGYVGAYQAATGVDLTKHADATIPSLLLRQRSSARPGQTLAQAPGQVLGPAHDQP